MGDTVLLDITDEIAVVTMNNPPVNAFTAELVDDIMNVFAKLKNEKVRVVVLTGAGDAFQAGADLNMFLDVKTEEDGVKFSKMCQDISNSAASIPCPVIAMINGLAMGGGTELSLACDIRIASKTASFGLPEVGFGVYPGGGGSQRLPRLIGPGKAKMLMLSGKIINAEEAFQLGLVEQVVEPDQLEEVTMKLAKMIAKKSPSAVSAGKRAIDKGLDVSLEEALKIEREGLGKLVTVGDVLEGANAFFEKRKPKFEIK